MGDTQRRFTLKNLCSKSCAAVGRLEGSLTRHFATISRIAWKKTKAGFKPGKLDGQPTSSGCYNLKNGDLSTFSNPFTIPPPSIPSIQIHHQTCFASFPLPYLRKVLASTVSLQLRRWILYCHQQYLHGRVLCKRCMPMGKFQQGYSKRPNVSQVIITAATQYGQLCI